MFRTSIYEFREEHNSANKINFIYIFPLNAMRRALKHKWITIGDPSILCSKTLHINDKRKHF